MKRVLNVVLALILIVSGSICFTGCFNKKDPIKRNLTQNLPSKVHVEYSDGVILVKDGDEYYARAITDYVSDRHEVYIKYNLSNPVVFDDPIYAQGYISARLAYLGGGNYAWQCAEDVTNYSSWHANDHNQTVYAKAEKNLRTGYTDINTPYEMTAVTIEQKANETVTVSGEQVECVVWEYTYDNGEIFNKDKYWYAKDTNIFIKHTEIFDKTEDINSDTHIKLKATYYKTGDSMAAALEVVSAHIGETRTKYTFDAKYR